MNRIILQIPRMAQKVQPEYIRLAWLVIHLALFLIGAGAPLTGGDLGE